MSNGHERVNRYLRHSARMSGGPNGELDNSGPVAMARVQIQSQEEKPIGRRLAFRGREEARTVNEERFRNWLCHILRSPGGNRISELATSTLGRTVVRLSSLQPWGSCAGSHDVLIGQRLGAR